jgi:signal transduction histidine kinase|tara:strand:- start:249 stop:581 length:333 start_codon:yes stop_codon:yes gene_type:complete
MEESDQEPEKTAEDEVRELINAALNLKPECLQTYKNVKELREKLRSVVSEYLDSFYIFGYDIEGNTVLVKGGHSDQQMDALDTLAMRLIMSGNLGGTHGSGGYNKSDGPY